MSNYSALQTELTHVALAQGALAVGYTKIRRTQPVMILAFPFSDKWFGHHPFFINRLFAEKFVVSRQIQDKLAQIIQQAGHQAHFKTAASVFGDFRPLAVAAGLGDWGKNGLVVHPQYGANMLFSAVFTDAPLQAEIHKTINANSPCNHCNKCHQACPAKAFSGNTFHFNRCFPKAVRGCAECIAVCVGTAAH